MAAFPGPSPPSDGPVPGGEMALDGHLLLDNELRFAVEWSLSNGDLGELARHMHNHRHDISGKVFSTLRVQGSQSGQHRGWAVARYACARRTFTSCRSWSSY